MKTELFISPTEILRDTHLNKYAKINRHLGRVLLALTELGSFRHVIKYSTNTTLIRISNLYGVSPYHHIDIYEDGYCGYFDVSSNIQFEGMTKRINILKLDIQKK